MKAFFNRFLFLLCIGFVYSVILTSTAFAATFEVDDPSHPSAGGGACKTGVANDCSFEEAVAIANATPGADDIVFNMPGFFPSWSISITAPISITEALTIDGYTQPWTSTPNTVPAPGLSDAILNVMIDGSGLKPGENCFDINTVVAGDPVLIKGFAIGYCPQHGISIAGSNVTIQGNYIGTTLSGTTSAPNGGAGIYVTKAHDIIIGGPNPADRNVISGNIGSGIEFSDSVNGSDIEGNFIGLDKTGLVGLGNGNFGIIMGLISSPASISGNNIGNGPSDIGNGKRNYIAGNTVTGIYVAGGWTTKLFGWNHIDNNYIGTDVYGTTAIANGKGGIDIFVSDDVRVEENLISGNSGNGVSVSGDDKAAITSNRIGIYTNLIGTDSSGTASLGNTGTGVLLHNGTNRSYVGDSTIPGSGNIIAYNTWAGVTVLEENPPFSTDDNKIEINSIYNNGGIGIDLASDGVTLNDASDADLGANNLQNYPIVESVVYSGGNTTITGSLHSVPLRDNYRIEVFANDAADPTGYGEGQTYLGSTIIAALDAFGDGAFTVVVAGDYTGKYITATTTDKSLRTSEFGPMASADLSISKTSTAASRQGESVTFTITVSNALGPNNATDVKVTDLIGGGFQYASYTASAGTYNSTTGIWDVGNLAFGSSETLTINAQVKSCGNLSNTATISASGQFDNDILNNAATANLTITCSPIAGGRPEGYVFQDTSETQAQDESSHEKDTKYCSYEFSPKDPEKITRYEFTKLMLEFNCYDLPTEMPEGTKSFSDYPRKTYEDVEENIIVATMYAAVDNGIINGYADGTLQPYSSIVNAEASKILYNALGEATNSYNPLWTILPKSISGVEWFAKYFMFIIELIENENLIPYGTVTQTDAENMVEFVLQKYPGV
ncbi:DUF11 domain-containing protein [Candidatus Peregrinibacteria bacterium]|nr:DUF11 domain-containing protein [Candidatus Peregrinibacteria bacterium]